MSDDTLLANMEVARGELEATHCYDFEAECLALGADRIRELEALLQQEVAAVQVLRDALAERDRKLSKVREILHLGVGAGVSAPGEGDWRLLAIRNALDVIDPPPPTITELADLLTETLGDDDDDATS